MASKHGFGRPHLGRGFPQVSSTSFNEAGADDPYVGMTLLTSFPTAINNAYWTKSATTVTTGRDDPYGGTTAMALFETATTAVHSVNLPATVNLANGSTYVMEAIVKPIVGRWLGFRVFNNDFSLAYAINVNPADGTIGTVVVDDGVNLTLNETTTAVAVAGGFYRFRLRFTMAIQANLANVYWAIRTGTSDNATYLGDITKGLDFYSLGIYRFF